MTSVYLDWNATAPPLPEVIDAVSRASIDCWGNAASVHSVGSKARRVLEDARDRVAALVNCEPFDVIFTSGGTEANNLALRAHLANVRHVLCSRLEHPSVIRVIETAAADHQVHWMSIEGQGSVDPEEVDHCLSTCDGSSLVVMQSVNHETGAVQPTEEVIRVAREHGALVHVDAVQAIGKLAGGPFRDADTVTLTAHKIRGPKGIGALIGGSCRGLAPLLVGGPQERRLRPGTVSVPLAVGFGVAASWALNSPVRYDGLRKLRDHLEDALIQLGGRTNCARPRVAHVTNVSFDGLRGDELVAALDVEGVCVSSGSACSAGSPEASAVIAAIHGKERSAGAVRASLGDVTTRGEIDVAIRAFSLVLDRLRPDG